MIENNVSKKTEHFIDYVRECEKILKETNKKIRKIEHTIKKLEKLEEKDRIHLDEKVHLEEFKRIYQEQLNLKIEIEGNLLELKSFAIKKATKLPLKAEKMGLDKNGYAKYMFVEYMVKNEEFLKKANPKVAEVIDELKSKGLEALSGNFADEALDPEILFYPFYDKLTNRQNSRLEMNSFEANKIARR